MIITTFKKIINRLHTHLGKIIRRLTNKESIEEIHLRRVTAWNKLDKNNSMRFDYPLDESSVVVDVGGFEGQWSSDIFDKYNCKIFIFEPVESFFQKIKERFNGNNSIICYNLGLSNRNESIDISLMGDRSSLIEKSPTKEQIKIVNASNFFIEKEIEKIDLIKINIEGGEYDLLDNLIHNDTIKKIKNIQVQFHDFVPNAKERMLKIREELRKTHYPTYQKEFVWENWRKIENDKRN